MIKRNVGFRNEKVLRPRHENFQNPMQKLIRSKDITYEDYDSGSDSENGTYESLVQINLRKSIENANRRAKIARVQKTGHPLFDHLREERAIKENNPRKKKSSPKTVKKPLDDNVANLPANNSFLHRREGIMQKPTNLHAPNRKSSSNSHLNNPTQVRNSKGMVHSVSLQQMSSARMGPNRKYSEGLLPQTLPRQLYQSRNFAKSEQNLFYLRSEVPNFHRQPSHMGQMFEFQARPTGRGFQRKHVTDSSDSDSDWLIPRPKFGQKTSNKNRSSDDSDVSRHPVRSKR